jgi:hypothetical protein
MSTVHKALVGSVTNYSCPAWEFAADINLMKLYVLQNKVYHTTGKFPTNTPSQDLYKAHQILYV